MKHKKCKIIKPLDMSTKIPIPETEMPPMCIDDEIDLDGNIKPGKPGKMID